MMEQLLKAQAAAQGTTLALRAAYAEAVAAGDEFAILHLLELITAASELQRRTAAACQAAAGEAVATYKKRASQ